MVTGNNSYNFKFFVPPFLVLVTKCQSQSYHTWYPYLRGNEHFSALESCLPNCSQWLHSHPSEACTTLALGMELIPGFLSMHTWLLIQRVVLLKINLRTVFSRNVSLFWIHSVSWKGCIEFCCHCSWVKSLTLQNDVPSQSTSTHKKILA